MKKIFSILLLCILLLSLTACKEKTTASAFFPDALLQQCHLDGLPAPEKSQQKANYLYCQLDEDSYTEYVETRQLFAGGLQLPGGKPHFCLFPHPWHISGIHHPPLRPLPGADPREFHLR